MSQAGGANESDENGENGQFAHDFLLLSAPAFVRGADRTFGAGAMTGR
jgi:hypothetical protein